MVRGSCLCGDVAWEAEGPLAPIESCHCPRCRKSSGAEAVPAVAVLREGFRFIRGEGDVRVFTLPVRERPPGYSRAFCSRCGAPVPWAGHDFPMLEMPAGSLDGDPGLAVQQHIYTDGAPSWTTFVPGAPRHPRHPPAAERAWRALPGLAD